MRKQPGLGLYYQYNLSENGKIYRKSRRRISHSFVTGFNKILFAALGGARVSITNTGGSGTTVNGYKYFVNAGAGASSYGLVVGTNNTAVAVTDTKLNTQVAHGAGAGQLQYSACTIAVPTFVGSTAELTYTRLFTNASGGTVTVEEIGVYLACTYGAEINNTTNICTVRDLATIAISNGTTLTLNYIIQTTL